MATFSGLNDWPPQLSSADVRTEIPASGLLRSAETGDAPDDARSHPYAQQVIGTAAARAAAALVAGGFYWRGSLQLVAQRGINQPESGLGFVVGHRAYTTVWPS